MSNIEKALSKAVEALKIIHTSQPDESVSRYVSACILSSHFFIIKFGRTTSLATVFQLIPIKPLLRFLFYRIRGFMYSI